MCDVLYRCFGESIASYLQVNDSSESPKPVEKSSGQSSQTDSMADGLSSLSVGLKQLFQHHLLQLRCNAHFASVLMSDGAEGSLHGVETTSEVQLGSVVYPTASLMNHSCAPNAIFR